MNRTRNIGVLNRTNSAGTGGLSTYGTQISYANQNAQGLAVNSNGTLTPTAVAAAVAPRIENQQSVNIGPPVPSGAAVAADNQTQKHRKVLTVGTVAFLLALAIIIRRSK